MWSFILGMTAAFVLIAVVFTLFPIVWLLLGGSLDGRTGPIESYRIRHELNRKMNDGRGTEGTKTGFVDKGHEG